MVVEGVVEAWLNGDMSAGMNDVLIVFKRDSHDAGMDQDEDGLVFVPVTGLDRRTGLPSGFHAVTGVRIIGEELMDGFVVFRPDHLEVGLGGLWRSAGKEREHDGVGW